MRRLGPALLLALLVAGCAAPSRSVLPGAPPPVDALSAWSAAGRIAIAAGDEGGSGSFTWRQDRATTTLGLRGPLGAGGLEVVASPGALALSDATGRRLDAEAARAELRARLGADVPWASLRYWMLGVPAPGGPAAVEDRAEAPRRIIDQDGWRIGYESYTLAAGYALPERFVATRPGIRVKVVVDDWQLPGGAVPAIP